MRRFVSARGRAGVLALAGVCGVVVACGRGSNAGLQIEAGTTSTTPLAPAGPATGTLLRRLTAEETGIVHQNTLRSERMIEYLTMGAGLAAGDYDNDGLVDLYLVSEEGPNHLYKNLGGWRFQDVTAAANADIVKLVAAGRFTERFNTGAHFADTDDDGDLDLFVTALAGAATLLRNDGDGTFTDITTEAGVGHIGASTSTTFGDYDRDGDVDLYVATHRPYRLTKYFPEGTAPQTEPELAYDQLPGDVLLAEADLLYRNRGDGTFEDVAASAGIHGQDYGLGVKFSDLNEDGWPDIYVANDFDSPDRLYINLRDGTFREEDAKALRHSPMFSMGMDTGDINNDGHLDIVTSDMLSPDRVRRQVQSVQSLDSSEMHAVITSGLAQLMRNSLHLSNGDGTFDDIAWFAGTPASDWTWTMKFADLDLDGYNDIVVTNGFVHDDISSDEQMAMSQLKQAGRPADLQAYARARPPLLTPNVIYRNNGDLTFANVATAWGFDEPSISHGVALADLDNDGDLDMVVNDLNAPVGVYRNDADGNRIKVALQGDASNSKGVGARLTLETADGTQTKEMSTSGGFLSGHEASVVFGLGSLPGALRLVVQWPSGHVSEIADPTANTALLIAEPAGPGLIVEPTAVPPPQFQNVASELGVSYIHDESAYDDFADQPLLPEKLSQYGPGVAWGDADDDGKPDLAIAGGRGQSGEAYRNSGGIRFEGLGGLVAPEGYEQQAMLWLPGGNLVASLSSVESGHGGPHPSLQLLRGTLDVSGVQLPGSAGALASSDFDGDGELDLFVGGRVERGKWPEGTSSGLFRGGDAALRDVTDQAAPLLRGIGMVTGAAWTDADGDGDPDLMLTRDMGSIALLANEEGRFTDETERAGLAALTGRWTGLATGDVDHDGDMDVVATNLGLNTPYRATADEPYVVFAGDLAGDGGVDVIEAEWEGGRLFPIRSATELGRQIPYFGARFESFQTYARAPMESVFGADRLAEATRRYEVATLAHTLLINDGSGAFTPVALPTAAQLMAAYGVVIEDLDNDTNPDIYLVGNFRGPEPMHIGLYDGGVSVWLNGDGSGGFVSAAVGESGLSVPEDAKGLAVADYNQDGWVDLTVGLNDGRLKIFENGGLNGRAGLVVRLAGPTGNPAGVGSRVTVRLADGTTQTREIQAGSSFLSQNSAILVFGLGAAAGAVEIEVTWPDGKVQSQDASPGVVALITKEP